MAGVKGKSGRHTHYDELAIADVVNLSIRTVRAYLNDEKIPLEKRVFVAKDFALKRMPQKIQADGVADKIIVIHPPAINKKEVVSGLIPNRVSI